jgi:hypothetical protein
MKSYRIARKLVDIFFTWVILGILIAAILCSFSLDHATAGLAGLLFWTCVIVGVIRARNAKRDNVDHAEEAK